MAEEGLEMMNGNSSPGVTQEYLNTQICALQGRINELAVAVTEVSKHTAELRFETNELRHQLKVQTERFWGVAIGGTLILASKDLGIFPETAAVVLLSGGLYLTVAWIANLRCTQRALRNLKIWWDTRCIRRGKR